MASVVSSPAGATFSAAGKFCVSSKREPAMSELEKGNDGSYYLLSAAQYPWR